MNNLKTHLTSISYVLFAGIIPSILMVYIMFKLLAFVEDTDFILSVLTIVTALSPVIASILGANVFFKFKRLTSAQSSIVDLWKYTLFYSLIFILLDEIYYWKIEPEWSGLGIIYGGCIGIVLAIFAYFKK